jgi:hypothetical protein
MYIGKEVGGHKYDQGLLFYVSEFRNDQILLCNDKKPSINARGQIGHTYEVKWNLCYEVRSDNGYVLFTV